MNDQAPAGRPVLKRDEPAAAASALAWANEDVRRAARLLTNINDIKDSLSVPPALSCSACTACEVLPTLLQRASDRLASVRTRSTQLKRAHTCTNRHAEFMSKILQCVGQQYMRERPL